MIKTEIFVELGSLGAVREYQKFIKDNQHIEIISVNILEHNNILLTYKD